MPSLYMPSASGSPLVSIPSVSEYLQFYSIVPCSTSHPTVSHYTSRLTAHYLLSLYYLALDILPLSVAPYSIFPSAIFYADGLWSAFPSAFMYAFWLGGKIIKWVASSCRAFNALDTWWFPIGYAPDEASLRLLRLFIPYIMGALPLISTISFLLIFERETVALSFVDLLPNLRQLLHCRPWICSFQKDDLPVSSIPSLSHFYSYLYISLARTSE